MEQTNRTMLFEQINPNKHDLLTMIGETGNKKSLKDEEVLEIHNALEISSFKEFIEKFDPTVYMLLDTNNGKVKFSKSYLGQNEEKIKVDSKDSLFQMLLFIMESRKRKRYILKGFCDLLENMIPRDDVKSFFEARKQILQYVKRYGAKIADYQQEKVQRFIKQYDDGIFLMMTFLQDMHNMLESHENNVVNDKAIFNDDANMQVHVIKRAEKYKYASLDSGEKELQSYVKLVQECIDSLKEKKELLNAQLIEDCFMLPLWFQQRKYELIQEKYNKYCKLYTDVLKKFWVEAKPLIETMLGVKEFFEQYQNTDGMRPRLVIGNFLISDLLNQNNRDKLDVYLNTVNSKNYYSDTIWYAIVPNLSTHHKVKKEIVRERFLSQNERYAYVRNHEEEVSLLLELLGKYKIQSFLSMENTEENTFSAFAHKGIEGINEELDVLEHLEEKDYIIPCFPNFIVIPHEQACINIGKVLTYDELEEKLYVKGNKNIWLDSIGIEASYIAAGLVAACQCPKYLRGHFGKKADEELPGISYRFSQNGHNLITTSDMLSETTEFEEKILEEAIAKSRGIFFGQHQGKMVMITDRVFSFSRSNQLLVSMVQTITYIERIIQYETQDYKKNRIIQFFQRRPGSIISKWYGNGSEAVNGIIKAGEELRYQIMEEDKYCIFEMYFKNIDLVRSEIVSIFSE